MSAQRPKIILQNICKSFGKKKVLQNVSLEVFPGESLAIIGGSGVGKSVLIKIILGLIEPDEGSIVVDGIEVTKLSSSQREKFITKYGMLFQGGALFDSLKVWENVSFGLTYQKKMKRVDAKKAAIERLKEVGLDAQILELYPSELSGGMQKRVSLARTIATSPEIIFFDEPTTGLDPIMSDVISKLIHKSVAHLGATAVTISHDISCVEKIADRIAFIHKGSLRWVGNIQEMKDTKDTYLYKFIHGQSE